MSFTNFEVEIVVGTKTNFENALNSLLSDGWVMDANTFRVIGESNEVYHAIVMREKEV